jgi:hypothetical protein
MRAILRIAAIATAAGLMLAPAAGLASAAAAAAPPPPKHPTQHVTGGGTSLTTVPGLVGSLTHGGIAVYATTPGTESLIGSASSPQLKFSFPVTGGSINPSHLSGTIKHRGGILLINTTNGHSIKLSRFNISLTHKHLSAIVLGTRVTVAHLSFSGAKVRVGLGTVRVRKIRAKLTTAAATALDTALGTTLFTPGMRIATVRTLVRF